MEVLFKTLTPLHIGNGEELNPLDYIKLNSVYCRINQRQFLDFIKNDDSIIEKYNEWVIGSKNKIDQLEYENRKQWANNSKGDFYQQLSALRKEFNLLSFIEKNTSLKNNFINFLNESKDIVKIRYSAEPKDHIRGLMKTSNNFPYVPGSSIKGAVRTALLYNFLSNTDKKVIAEIIISNIQDFSKEKQMYNIRKEEFEKNNRGKQFFERFSTDKYFKTFGGKIEQLAFYCKAIDENDKTKDDDDRFDILKLLSFSDAILEKNEITLANLNLYLILKEKDRYSGKFEETAKRQTQAPCVEAIPENSFFRVDIDFNIQFLLNLKDKIQNDSVIQGDKTVWIGIREKVKNIFNLDIYEITKENAEQKQKGVIEHIFYCMRQFSKDQLEFEKKWIADFTAKDRSNQFRNKIITGYKPIFENEGILLHLGFTSGFFGLTEFLFYKSDNELKSLIKQVMELFSIGDKPGTDKKRRPDEKYTANPDKFPKSRRLTEVNGALKPMGWIQLSNNEELEALNLKFKNEPESFEEVARKVREAKDPKLFTGKLKQGAGPIDAEVVKSGNPNFVKLFIEGIEYPVEMRGNNSPLETGKIVVVFINQITAKGEIKQVGFKGFKEQ